MGRSTLRQGQPNIGDVTAAIGGSAITGAVTGNVSRAIASLGKSCSAKNVTIGQAGVGTQVTDSFVNMAYAMLVPVVIVFAPPLVVIGAFVVLAVRAQSLEK